MFVVLNSHPTNAGEGFDPVRTGLDHVGFTVPDRAAIDEWVAKLEEKGVTYSPVTEHDWGWSLNFRDPDDVQLQLIAFAPALRVGRWTPRPSPARGCPRPSSVTATRCTPSGRTGTPRPGGTSAGRCRARARSW